MKLIGHGGPVVRNLEGPIGAVIIQNKARLVRLFDHGALRHELQGRKVIKTREGALHKNPFFARYIASDENSILVDGPRYTAQGIDQIIGNLVGVTRIKLRQPPDEIHLPAEG